MKAKLEKLFKGQLPVALVFILLGLCLISMPAGTLNILYKIVFGLALVLAGGSHMYAYLAGKSQYSLLDLFSGVTTIIMGLFLFTNPQIVIMMLPWMLAGFVIGDCVWIVRDALKKRKAKAGSFWQVMLAVVAISVVLSIILAVNPFRTVRSMLSYAGWVLFLKGMADVAIHFLKDKGKGRVKDAGIHTSQSYSVVPSRPGKPVVSSRGRAARAAQTAQPRPAQPQASAGPVPSMEDIPAEEMPVVEPYDQDNIDEASYQEAAYTQDAETEPQEAVAYEDDGFSQEEEYVGGEDTPDEIVIEDIPADDFQEDDFQEDDQNDQTSDWEE
ncbi:MAG: DUF308 domain-containing protein [Blautia sp.]|nr:DUF308 domain-containing protein [Blautia sp.]